MTRDIDSRWRVNADLWSPRPAPRAAEPLVRRVDPRAFTHTPPPPPRRRTLQDTRSSGDAKKVARAARTMGEFLDAQERLAQAPSRQRRRTLADKRKDDRVWLDAETYVAWTIDGELVAVLDVDRSKSRWSPQVTRLTNEQRRVLVSFDLLVPTVIALYPGDDLEQSPITRFYPHFDLAAAHRAARRSLETEIPKPTEAVEEPAPEVDATPAPRPPIRRLKKSRFHPEGNFVLIAPPPPESGLPDYAVVLPAAPPRRAFESRRDAIRAATRMQRQGMTELAFTPARVIGAVEVRPVFRKDLNLPRDPSERLELLRREPRIVLPDLDAAWLPRYEQGEDREWRPQPFRLRRSVRHGVNARLLHELGRTSEQLAERLEAVDLQQSVGRASDDLQDEVLSAMRVSFRAQRRLPESWLERLGLERDSIAPDWRDLATQRHEAPRTEDGHWLRAPCEYGEKFPDGLRSRMVELRIVDMAGLVELRGWKPVFWLVKPSVKHGVRWVLPVLS